MTAELLNHHLQLFFLRKLNKYLNLLKVITLVSSKLTTEIWHNNIPDGLLNKLQLLSNYFGRREKIKENHSERVMENSEPQNLYQVEGILEEWKVYQAVKLKLNGTFCLWSLEFTGDTKRKELRLITEKWKEK